MFNCLALALFCILKQKRNLFYRKLVLDVFYILEGHQFHFLQSSTCLGTVPAGGDLLETGSVVATEKHMTTIWERYTKYIEMPARRMS